MTTTSDSDPFEYIGGGTTSELSQLKGVGTPLKQGFYEEKFWKELLTKKMETDATDSTGKREFLRLSSDLQGNPLVLIKRACYNRLVSRVIHCWNKESRQCLVTGTPGIGKTIFGFFLIRHLLHKRLTRSIAYVVGQSLYVITTDEKIKQELGLATTVSVFRDIKDRNSNVILQDSRFVVIHDPERSASLPSIDASASAPCRIFILSYGHHYLTYFKGKALGPSISFWFYMPLWDEAEGDAWYSVLKIGNKHLKVKESWNTFGGTLRKWLQAAESDEALSELQETLRSYVATTVKAYPKGGIQNHTDQGDWRGTLVQIDTPFEDNLPLWDHGNLKCEIEEQSVVPNASATTVPDEGASDQVVPEEETHPPEDSEEMLPNSFKRKTFVIGSHYIQKKLVEESASHGKESHFSFLAALSTESGFEDMYGRVFEPHCHNFIKEIGGTLRLKRLTMNGNDGETTIDLPKAREVLRFKGNDPRMLESLKSNWCSDCSYLQPYSTSFPMYDSIFVVTEDVIRKNKSKRLIAMNFQMTVSGASGLPPRPKHAMRRYVRGRINAVCKKASNLFVESVTVFVVPDLCFDNLEFQKEFLKDVKSFSQLQPREQFLVAMPEEHFKFDNELPHRNKRLRKSDLPEDDGSL